MQNSILTKASPGLYLPQVIGHRGACGSAPENTLAAILQASRLGAQWVELDITLSADKHPVAAHDLTLDRCTNGTGALRKRSWQALQQLDAGSWFADGYRGENIPDLQAVIREVQKLSLGFNLEIKPAPGWEQETAHVIIDHLESTWLPEERQQLLISSFSETVLHIVQERLPWAARGYLAITTPPDWQKRLNELGCETLNCHHQFVTKELCNQAKAANIRLLAYTVNNAEEALRLLNYGVDSVFSDYPEQILAQL